MAVSLRRRKSCSDSYPNAGWRPYNGTHPHHDHLHVELSWNSARTLTAQRVQQVLGSSGGDGAPTPPAPGQRPTLRRGSTGPAVSEAQRILNAWYPSLPELAVDGDFGPLTEARVRYMQGRAGLAVDGVVGAADLAPSARQVTAMRTAVIAAFALALGLLAAHAWRRVGEIEAQMRASEDELANRD